MKCPPQDCWRLGKALRDGTFTKLSATCDPYKDVLTSDPKSVILMSYADP